MFKYIAIILVFFQAFICRAQSKSPKIDSLTTEIATLRTTLGKLQVQLDNQNNQINSQTGMLDTAFDGVSSQLGASSIFVGIFGIIITIFTILLSIYVAKMEKSIRNMKADTESLLERNIQIKQEVEALSQKITRNSTGLYKLVRNEESNHLIERLISVPEDISNLFPSLASRDLEGYHFPKLKEAFIQMLDDKTGKKESYLILLFQHFAGLSILDPEIKPQLLPALETCLNASFKNDATKSAFDYFTSLCENDISKFKKEINDFAVSLGKSDYSNSEAVFFAINNAVPTRDLKFLLFDTIDNKPETLIFRKALGKLILDYKYENLNLQESGTIDNIKKILV